MLIQLSELNRNSAEIMKQNHTPKRLIGEKGKSIFNLQIIEGRKACGISCETSTKER